MIEIQAARWEHLAKKTIDNDYSEETFAIQKFSDFERWFNRYHTHILLTEWVWAQDSKEPYVFIEKHGIFSDLNKLAQRITNEAKLQLENKMSNFKFSINSSNGEVLQINMPWENRYVSCEFISLDDTQSGVQASEGWKFDVNPGLTQL